MKNLCLLLMIIGFWGNSALAAATSTKSCKDFRAKVEVTATEFGSVVELTDIPAWYRYGPESDPSNRGGKSYGVLICAPDDLLIETFDLCARPAFPLAAMEFLEILKIVGAQLGIGSDNLLGQFDDLYTEFLTNQVAGDVGRVKHAQEINGYEFFLSATADDGATNFHEVCLFYAMM